MMKLATLLERMNPDHPAAQLDGIVEHGTRGDVDFRGCLA